MADILHRFTIEAPLRRIHDLVATAQGVERWWTGHSNSRDGTTLRIFFRDGDQAAVFEIVEDTPQRIVWNVVDGPSDWIGTTITFALERRPDEGTNLLFPTPAGARPMSHGRLQHQLGRLPGESQVGRGEWRIRRLSCWRDEPMELTSGLAEHL